MGLQSQCFRGQPQLEAAAVNNNGHIVPGSVGPHVARIQYALLVLGEVGIDAAEQEGQRYGQSTASAVLAYKTKRSIINRSYQSKADDIVGIMTMAALDKEMLALEGQPTAVRTSACRLDGGRPRGG